jgi:hypothetical protein
MEKGMGFEFPLKNTADSNLSEPAVAHEYLRVGCYVNETLFCREFVNGRCCIGLAGLECCSGELGLIG